MKKLCLFSALLLTVFALNAAEPPLITVPAGTPSAIDGTYRKDKWINAAHIGNFQDAVSRRYVTQQTFVRLLHDRHNLYCAVRLDEFALNPSSNMTAEFRAEQKGRQAMVWYDDCFEVRIAPPGLDGQFFYFGFNANGATHAIAPQGYAPDFDKKIQLKTSRSPEGFWYAELAIPLDIFFRNGAKKDLRGDWRINFLRFEQRLKEKSSWAQLDVQNPGSHGEFSQLGYMRLGSAETPVAGVQDFQNIGKEISLQFAAGKKWDVAVYGECTDNKKAQFDFAVRGRMKAGLDALTAHDPAAGRNIAFLQYHVACDGKVFYVSPELPVKSYASATTLGLPEKVKSITLNGKPLAYEAKIILPGNATDAVLEIEAESQALPVQLMHNGVDWTGEWEAFDGQKWVPAEKTDSGVKLSGAAAPVKFRKMFRQNATQLETALGKRQDYTVTAGDAWILNWETFATVGWDKNVPLNDLKLHLIVPESVKVIAAASRIRYPDGYKVYNFPPEANQYRIAAQQSRTVNGEAFTEYLIERTAPLTQINMFPDHQARRECCSIAFVAAPQLTDREVPIFYYCESDHATRSEVPQQINLNVLPQLQGVQPKDVRIICFLFRTFSDIAEPVSRDGYMNLLKHSGINTPWLENIHLDPAKYGMELAAFMFFEDYDVHPWMYGSISLKNITDKYPEAKQAHECISMTWLLNHPEIEPLIDDSFRAARLRYPQHRLMCLDYESDPFKESRYVEYSKPTLDTFAKEYNIKENLTKEVVLEKYRTQWADFMCRQLARLSGLFHKYAAKNGFLFAVYSGYQTPENKNLYGIDWNYFANGVVDYAIMGYGRQKKIIADSRAALQSTPSFYGVLGGNDMSCRRSTLCRRIVDSEGTGLLCWYEYGFSGTELTELAETTRLVAAFEPMFKSKPLADGAVKVSGTDPDNVIVYRQDGKYLVLILNEDTHTEMDVTVSLPAGKFQEFYSGKKMPGNSVQKFTVEAGKICAVYSAE